VAPHFTINISYRKYKDVRSKPSNAGMLNTAMHQIPFPHNPKQVKTQTRFSFLKRFDGKTEKVR
jgi:hypothetical protein